MFAAITQSAVCTPLVFNALANIWCTACASNACSPLLLPGHLWRALPLRVAAVPALTFCTTHLLLLPPGAQGAAGARLGPGLDRWRDRRDPEAQAAGHGAADRGSGGCSVLAAAGFCCWVPAALGAGCATMLSTIGHWHVAVWQEALHADDGQSAAPLPDASLLRCCHVLTRPPSLPPRLPVRSVLQIDFLQGLGIPLKSVENMASINKAILGQASAALWDAGIRPLLS